MYVHKNYIRDWVIHTRHIKRLDREAMGKMNTETLKRKRKHHFIDDNYDDPPQKSEKKLKTLDIDASFEYDDEDANAIEDDILESLETEEEKPRVSKRIRKPVQHFDDISERTTLSLPPTKYVLQF